MFPKWFRYLVFLGVLSAAAAAYSVAYGAGDYSWGFVQGNHSPADASAYSGIFSNYVTGAADDTRVTVSNACTITSAAWGTRILSTLGSGENATWGIYRNGVKIPIFSAAGGLVDYDSTPVNVVSTSLNIAIAAGDTLDFYTDNPTWATNPVQVRTGGSAVCEVAIPTPTPYTISSVVVNLADLDVFASNTFSPTFAPVNNVSVASVSVDIGSASFTMDTADLETAVESTAVPWYLALPFFLFVYVLFSVISAIRKK